MAEYVSIAGIGDVDDLQYVGVQANTVDSIDFQSAGILASNGVVASDVIADNINEWNPVIKTGYGYINGREYYAYAEKCTAVWTVKDIKDHASFIYDDSHWNTKVTDLDTDLTLSGYCQTGIYVPSGYFSIKITDVKSRAPICVSLLPLATTPDYIDADLSGYLYLGTMTSTNGSGYKYYASEYMNSSDIRDAIIASYISNGDMIPRFSKGSPFGFTGFVEEYDKSYAHSGYPIIGQTSGIITYPCISINYNEFDPTQSKYAQYVNDLELLIIPGSISNAVISYETSDSENVILRDINVNPLNATDENQLIAVTNFNTSGYKIIKPTVSDSVIASELASTTYLHYSITDDKGVGCSGFRLSVAIDKQYQYLSTNSGYLPADVKYKAILMNGVELYQLTLPTNLVNTDGILVIDENMDVQLITNSANMSGVYYTNSYGSLLGAGGHVVNASGYLYTNEHGSATARYLANNNQFAPRRSYIANIKADHSQCTSVISGIYVQNKVQAATHVTADVNFLPDIRTVIDVTPTDAIGYTLSNWPLGGPTAVKFYNASEWFNAQINETPEPSPIGIGTSITLSRDVTVNFKTTQTVVAVYKTIENEILKSDDYTVLE